MHTIHWKVIGDNISEMSDCTFQWECYRALMLKKSVNLSSNSPLAMIVDEHEPILELREEVVAPGPGGTSESSIEKSSWVADKYCSTTVVFPKDNLLVKQRRGITRISPSDARARIQELGQCPKTQTHSWFNQVHGRKRISSTIVEPVSTKNDIFSSLSRHA